MKNLGFLGFPDYDVTEDGKVWSHHSSKFLKISISINHHDKYAKVMLSNNGKRKFITVHRLVAFAYLDKPEGKDYVNHIDGDIHNNHVNNLEWVTALENNLHSIDNVRTPQFTKGFEIELPPRGDRKDRGKGRHNITEYEAVQYCEYMMQGYRGCDLRVMMGISPELFTKFKNKRDFKYKYVADRYDFSHLPSVRKTTKEEVIAVCEMLQDGHTIMHTYKTLNMSRTTVRMIAYRKRHIEISKDYTW